MCQISNPRDGKVMQLSPSHSTGLSWSWKAAGHCDVRAAMSLVPFYSNSIVSTLLKITAHPGLAKGSVLVSRGCCNKLPQASRFKTTQIHSFTVRGTQSLKSKCQRGHSPCKGLGQNLILIFVSFWGCVYRKVSKSPNLAWTTFHGLASASFPASFPFQT